MVRDRLPELEQKLQQKDPKVWYKNGNKDNHKNKKNAVMGLDQLLVEVDAIREFIQELRSNVSAAKQCFFSISCPIMNEGNQNELNQVSEKIKSMSRDIRTAIKSLNTDYTSTAPLNQTLQKAAFTQHSSLLKEFLDLMHDYQKNQVEYHDKRKAQLDLTVQIVGINNNEDDATDPTFTGNLLYHTNEAKQSLTQVQERHDEILTLQKSIEEVNDLFLEVSLLVTAQGDMVDRIENFATDSAANTAGASKTLLKAKQKKKKYRKRRNRLLLAGAGVVAVTIGIMLL